MTKRMTAGQLRSVATVALMAGLAAPAWSGTLDDNVLLGTAGDGLIFSDPAEGVLPPGIKPVTGIRLIDGVPTPVDPLETDFSDLESRGDVTNCLMANNPEVYCDSPGGSGKRVKIRLTGPVPFDMRLSTTASDQYPAVDYFTFGKVSNLTGARIVGFSIELLDAAGNPMSELDPAAAVLYNLAATDLGIGSRLPDGLYGEGGQEGEIGFFNSGRASLVLSASSDELSFGALTNTHYVTNFGTAMLDDTMLPDGLFWDDNGDPSDESALVAWNNLAGGGWTYGILDTADNLDARLQELADTLGVTVAELGYANGGPVPPEIVARMTGDSLFAVAPIEDLRNANVNYTITVGNVEGGEFIIRYRPRFATIVEETTSEYQFRTAGYLDAVANVPFWDVLDTSGEYQAEIARILALDPAEQAEALEQMGFSFLGAFSGLGMNLGRDQVLALGKPQATLGSDGATLSSKGGDMGWSMGQDLSGFASIHGGRSSQDTTANNIGYDVDTRGITAGVEKQLSPTASVGLMVGGLNGDAEALNDRGSIEAQGYSLAAFGRSTFGNGGSVQAILGFQGLSFDTRRNVNGEVAAGATDGSQTFFALHADYQMRHGALTWGPMASFEHYRLKVDGFDETGAGIYNLSLGEQSGKVTLVSAGVRGDYAMDAAGATKTYGSIALTKVSGDDALVASGFVGLPGSVTPVDGLDSTWVDVNLGVSSRIATSGGGETRLGAEYRGAFGSDYESHGLGVFLMMNF